MLNNPPGAAKAAWSCGLPFRLPSRPPSSSTSSSPLLRSPRQILLNRHSRHRRPVPIISSPRQAPHPTQRMFACSRFCQQSWWCARRHHVVRPSTTTAQQRRDEERWCRKSRLRRRGRRVPEAMLRRWTWESFGAFDTACSAWFGGTGVAVWLLQSSLRPCVRTGRKRR